MNRIVVALVTVTAAGALLAGCGGDSPYCSAVKENQKALRTFGSTQTTASFTKEATAVRAVASTEPEGVADEWAAIDKAMRSVISAQKKVGVTFDDLADPQKRAEVDNDDIATIDRAYARFNDTAKQRKAIVADIQKTCDVSLAPGKEK